MQKGFISLMALVLCACTTYNPLNNINSGNSSGSFSGGSSNSVTEIGSSDLTTFDIALPTTPLSSEPNDLTVLPGDNGDFVELWDAYKDNDLTSISLTWQGDSIAVSGTAKNVTVTIQGSHATIVSAKKKIHYILSGNSTNGSVKIYSDAKFVLTLNDLHLTNPNGPVINIQKGKTQEEDGGYPHKTVYVQLTEGTTNTLTDGSEYATSITVNQVEEDQKACFFSEGQLVFSGKGTLTVTGNNQHAICSDDYIRIRPGVQLTVYAKGEDGIKGNDYVIIGGGTTQIQVTSTAGKGIKGDTVYIAGGKTTILTSGSGMYDSQEKDVSACAGVKAGYLTIDGGELYCKSTGAGGKGISVDQDMVMNDGTVHIITTGSVYQYSRNLDSNPKGIKVDNNLTIYGGQIKVRATGAQEGSEGIEAKNTLAIHGGIIESYCTDDAFNAAKSILITSGYIYAYSLNNDAIDSNGTISISGGVIVASGTTAPEGGLDCDQNNFAITGGYIVGIGGENSTPTSSTTQPCLICGGSCNQNAVIAITDADGKLVMSYVPERTYSQMSLLTSNPGYTKGNTYTVTSGGTISGGEIFHGLNLSGTVRTGTTIYTATLSSMVTTVGSTGGMGGGGGQPGGGGPGGGGGGPRW